MKVLLTIIPPLLFSLCLSGQSPVEDHQADSLQKIQMHGVSIEAFGKNYIYYNLGYEYISYSKKNGFGFSTNFSYHLKHAPASNKKLLYNALFFGVGGIYEFGQKFGFRTNLNTGLRIIPEVYTDKFDNAQIIEADQPSYYYWISTLGIGPFYRTKNYKWQFIVEFYYQYTISKRPGFLGNDYMDYFHFPWLGITIKYNFITNET